MSSELVFSFIDGGGSSAPSAVSSSGLPSTGISLLIIAIIVLAIALLSFLLFKKKLFKSLFVLSGLAVCVLAAAGIAYAANTGLQIPDKADIKIDADGNAEPSKLSFINNDASVITISSVSLNELEDTGGATWKLKIDGNPIYDASAGVEQPCTFTFGPGQTSVFEISAKIDNNIAKSLLGKAVLKATFILTDGVKVSFSNVDLSSAGKDQYIAKGQTTIKPISGTTPPRSVGWELEDWYDASGLEPIDFSKPINEDTTFYAHYKDPGVSIVSDYECTNFMTKGNRGRAQQGFAIYNNTIISGEDAGNINLYNFSDGGQGDASVPRFANFALQSSGTDNHVNNIELGTETVPGAEFPLLYISNGKVGSSIEFVCYVESVSKKDDNYTSQIVQTISIEPNHRETWRAKGYIPIFGAPSWMIDPEENALWIFSAYQRTTPKVTQYNWQNEYIATKFRIPKLSEGSEILFGADDILDQVVFPYETGFTQSGCMHNGIIYYCYGVGEDPTRPQRIRAYNTHTGKIEFGYNLENDINSEPEDLVLRDGYLYLNCNTPAKSTTQEIPKIYKITMPRD